MPRWWKKIADVNVNVEVPKELQNLLYVYFEQGRLGHMVKMYYDDFVEFTKWINWVLEQYKKWLRRRK